MARDETHTHSLADLAMLGLFNRWADRQIEVLSTANDPEGKRLLPDPPKDDDAS